MLGNQFGDLKREINGTTVPWAGMTGLLPWIRHWLVLINNTVMVIVKYPLLLGS
jgi:hypothetical protein